MKHILIYPIGSTDACSFAVAYLKKAGFSLTDHPSPEVTHLLLDIPSFRSDGFLRDGASLPAMLERLPAGITIVGGNLEHPGLAEYSLLDLLRDAEYLARNAAITAECALRIAAFRLTTILADTPALIIGWGRIGKCLAKLLSGLGCPVTIAARNPSDRAMARALGWAAVDISGIPPLLSGIGVIFNTVPAPILGKDTLDTHEKCVKIDMASIPGLEGQDVIRARGLPGLYAPESSGGLIAETIARYLREEAK